MQLETSKVMVKEIFNHTVSKLSHLLVRAVSAILPSKGIVYMFHSVGDNRHAISIDPLEFRCFIEGLKKDKVIRLEQWKNRNGFISLTFDDVASSFYENAFPILKKHQIPFTIFVSCSLIDAKGFLTKEQLKEIADCELCTVGSHGFNHVFFKNFSKEEAEFDLRKSKVELEKITQRPISLYAFPYGSIYACGFNNIKLVKKYYKYGFGTVSCKITTPSLLPSYFLPRISMSQYPQKN